CDGVETAVAWKAAVERRNGPTSLLLSRQNVNPVARTDAQVEAVARGGYVLVDGGPDPEAIIIATGSEVQLALDAAARLNAGGRKIRVVSMPSTDVFDRQDAAYREEVLPSRCRRRVAVEAGIPDYWHKYVGLDGKVLGVPDFGVSAPGPDVYRHFGLTAEALAAMVESMF